MYGYAAALLNLLRGLGIGDRAALAVLEATAAPDNSTVQQLSAFVLDWPFAGALSVYHDAARPQPPMQRRCVSSCAAVVALAHQPVAAFHQGEQPSDAAVMAAANCAVAGMAYLQRELQQRRQPESKIAAFSACAPMQLSMMAVRAQPAGCRVLLRAGAAEALAVMLEAVLGSPKQLWRGLDPGR